MFQRTAPFVEYSGCLPTASPASRASAQNVTGCITPPQRGPTTIALPSPPPPPHRRHPRPETGAATGQDKRIWSGKQCVKSTTPAVTVTSLCCSSSTWCCLHCTKVNSIQNVQCKECERPRSSSVNSNEDESQSSTISGQCCLLIIPPAPSCVYTGVGYTQVIAPSPFSQSGNVRAAPWWTLPAVFCVRCVKDLAWQQNLRPPPHTPQSPLQDHRPQYWACLVTPTARFVGCRL